MGFFDLFKDPLERHLEHVYIPSYRMMGMSEQEARAMFKVWLADAKEQVAKRNRFVAPDNLGSDLLRRESAEPKVADHLKKLRSDGVTNKDFVWFWNMPSLERVMMMRNFEWHVGAMHLSKMRQGLIPEQAWIETRKFHPYYGDAEGPADAIGENKPIPFELKDRVDIYILNRHRVDSAEFEREMRGSSSFNALARKEIRSGRL